MRVAPVAPVADQAVLQAALAGVQEESEVVPAQIVAAVPVDPPAAQLVRRPPAAPAALIRVTILAVAAAAVVAVTAVAAVAPITVKPRVAAVAAGQAW